MKHLVAAALVALTATACTGSSNRPSLAALQRQRAAVFSSAPGTGVSRVTIGNGVRQPVVSMGAVWVLTTSAVVKLDPRTGSPTAEIPLPKVASGSSTMGLGV